MEVLKRNHTEKIKQIEDESEIRIENQINKRVA